MVARQGHEIAVCVQLAFARPVEEPEFTLTFRNEARHIIFVASSQTLSEPTGRFDAGEEVTLRFVFMNRLAPSRYTITPAIGDGAGGREAHGYSEDLTALIVQATHQTGGVVDIPFELELDRT
jgi:hypothetical protein